MTSTCEECNNALTFTDGAWIHDDPTECEAVPDYVNEECPERCSDPHYVEPDAEGQTTCEETGEVYNWCEPCNEWSAARVRGAYGRYTVEHEYIVDQWMCEDCRSDYFMCPDCEEWVHCDYAMSDEDGYGELYCESCYEEHRSTGTPIGVSVRHCSICESGDVHLDEFTGEFLCDHKAQDRMARRFPVVTAYPLNKQAVAA